MPGKPKPRTPEQELKDCVCTTVIDHLTKVFKRSKFKPNGGFRQGYGYSFKVYGLMEIVTVNALFYGVDGENVSHGRLMINTSDNYSVASDKRKAKIVRAIDKQTIEDISLRFEIDCANGHSLWFAWTIQ